MTERHDIHALATLAALAADQTAVDALEQGIETQAACPRAFGGVGLIR